MKYSGLIFCFNFFLSISLLYAGNGGSGYSRFGLGDIRFFSSERAAGMGGASLAVFSGNSIDRNNPATWSEISRTRFSLSAFYDGFRSDNGGSSVFLSGTGFGGMMIAIPIYTPSGIVFGMGITPYSTVNYNTKIPSQDTLPYVVTYSGEGGLSEGLLGCSWSPRNDISLGMKFSYYFGTIRHNISQTFSVSDYSNAEEIRSLQLHGAGVSLGIVYSGFGALLKLDSTRQLSLGMNLSSGTTLNMNEEHYLTYTATNQQITTRDTINLGERHLSLPLRLGIGAAFRTPEFVIASDVLFQRWSSFTATGAIAGTFRDSYRLNVGAELFPRREGTASFLQHIAYRAGFFYDASYYKIYGNPINETGFTAGFGIPVISDTRLNISAEYGLRGLINQGLTKDKILRLSFTLSGSERWFIPSEEE